MPMLKTNGNLEPFAFLSERLWELQITSVFLSSSRRRPGSIPRDSLVRQQMASIYVEDWIPAYAGMTNRKSCSRFHDSGAGYARSRPGNKTLTWRFSSFPASPPFFPSWFWQAFSCRFSLNPDPCSFRFLRLGYAPCPALCSASRGSYLGKTTLIRSAVLST